MIGVSTAKEPQEATLPRPETWLKPELPKLAAIESTASVLELSVVLRTGYRQRQGIVLDGTFCFLFPKVIS